MRNHNIIILLYICQCTSPDIHTQVQARNLPWSRLGHRFSWHKKIIRTSLLCVWHFRRMFLTNNYLGLKSMYSFLPILIILSSLTYQLCSALALGESWDGEALAGTEAGPGPVLPTPHISDMDSGRPLIMRLDDQYRNYSESKHFWIPDQLNKLLAEVCWRASLFV